MPKIDVSGITSSASDLQSQNKPKKNMPIDPNTLDTLLQTGVQATATIVGQRAASGKSAMRQERIAQCGRRPLFGRQKKQAYNECVAKLGSSQERSAPINYGDGGSQGTDEGSNNTLLYVGVSVLVLGIVGFILYKKFGK